MKKFLFVFVILFVLFFNFNIVLADDEIPVPPEIPNETFIIRNGDSVIWQGSVPLPDESILQINDNLGNPHNVSSRSVLGLLSMIDISNDSFSVSNLQYYDSFGSFYLKCISSVDRVENCDNWQYAVGNTTPWESIENVLLTGGETVGIYFGTPHHLVLDKNEMNVGDSVFVKAEKYDYENNIWNPLTGISVGVTVPNPDDAWNPTVISSNLVDDQGLANIIIENSDSYTLGIVEDYYFPSYNLLVKQKPDPVISGGGGGGPLISNVFNLTNAISFLKSKQNPDGSFGGNMYTDWSAIALSANNINDDAINSILSFLNINNSLSSILTDNERRAITLLSLNKNPYNFNGVDYINNIVNSFDGTQFGDSNLLNDDIFALIPLANSGYTSNDEIIQKDISFLLLKQNPDGSFENSIDLTSAGIMALNNFNSIDGVNNALLKAENYLSNLQNPDGGWGNVSSTSWVLQAMNSVGLSWSKNGHTGLDYLSFQQATDGGAISTNENIQNRIWITSYAISAVLGKSWNNIMQYVSKPLSVSGGGSVENNEQIKTIATEDKKEIIIEPVIVSEVKKEIISDNLVKEDVINKFNINDQNINNVDVVNKKDISEVKKEINDSVLSASVKNTKTKIPTPIALGAVISGLGFAVFRFFKFIL
ncbi:terpene cyclase/mutase family protein [Candidatus Nomurabacteria bacterium]|nr:terpene cyclase/mutase family protein [Candidatus Nomurabacteria bacterium]